MYCSGVKSRLNLSNVPRVAIPLLWQRSFTALSDNLSAMRLLPLYFPSVPSFQRRDVDVSPIVAALRTLTSAVSAGGRMEERTHYVLRPGLAGARNICDSDDSTECAGCKGMAGLFNANTRVHADSLRPMDEVEDPGLQSSWSGYVVAESFFMHAVLGLWDDGQPTDPKVFKRLMAILIKDIETSEATLLGADNCRLWFWKVFVVAYGLRAMVAYGKDSGKNAQRAGQNKRNSPPGSWFSTKIRKWSTFSGIQKWSDAKDELQRIVWPDTVPDEGIAEEIWAASLYNSPRGDPSMSEEPLAMRQPCKS